MLKYFKTIWIGKVYKEQKKITVFYSEDKAEIRHLENATLANL